jgi:site-specific DNA-methyltransferase (adenine-specific)
MEYMATLPDKAFDLAIVDPPYGIGEFCMTDGDGGVKWDKKWNQDWNNEIPSRNYFELLLRISKHQIIWGANYYNCFSQKGGAIVWFKHVKHPSMSKCEIASNTLHKKVEYVDIVWQNVNRPTSPIHPCEKPIKLYEWLLTNYAKPGQRILDTHLGSGSSAIAAHNLGFDFVGCELDRDYYEAALKRFNAHAAQQSLFGNETDCVTKKVQQEVLL